jgi:glutathione S-transferase
MTLKLYAHPFSAYCQKVLIALYENATPFEFRMLAPEGGEAAAELEALWPLKRFPVLVDAGRTVLEASIIVEHLGLHHPGPVRLVPEDPRAALPVRMMDRVFDNYVATPMQKIVFDSIRAEADRDWAAGGAFSLADCAAAPSLFYADWTHPIDERFANLRAYRRRLLARPSFARAVDEARPYRPLFPLGAPERD